MATDMKVYKVTALPGVFQPSALYLVPVAGEPTLLDLYVASSDGLTVRNIISKTEIAAMISAAGVGGASSTVVVADIAARDLLAPSEVTIAIVLDATGDLTVAAGSATYVFNPDDDTWTKISESESMDLVLTWANITDGPSSTPGQVDAAVAATHTHANMVTLDKFSEDQNGSLLFDGNAVSITLSANEW